MYDTTMVDTCYYIHLSKSIECTTPRVNPNVTYGIWVKMICHCRFIDCNKCTTMVQDVNSGGGCMQWGIGYIWEHSVLSTQFCCEPKTALKNGYHRCSFQQQEKSVPLCRCSSTWALEMKRTWIKPELQSSQPTDQPGRN